MGCGVGRVGRVEMMVIDCCLMPPACIILCQCQACNSQLGGNISVVLLLGGGGTRPCGFRLVAPCIGRSLLPSGKWFLLTFWICALPTSDSFDLCICGGPATIMDYSSNPTVNLNLIQAPVFCWKLYFILIVLSKKDFNIKSCSRLLLWGLKSNIRGVKPLMLLLRPHSIYLKHHDLI